MNRKGQARICDDFNFGIQYDNSRDKSQLYVSQLLGFEDKSVRTPIGADVLGRSGLLKRPYKHCALLRNGGCSSWLGQAATFQLLDQKRSPLGNKEYPERQTRIESGSRDRGEKMHIYNTHVHLLQN